MADTLIAGIKEKVGFQERVTYCRDCVNAVKNETRKNRKKPLLCNKYSDLAQFPVSKMSTCGKAEMKELPHV